MRKNTSHSQNSHEGASSNVFRLLSDTNMFLVWNRIQSKTRDKSGGGNWGEGPQAPPHNFFAKSILMISCLLMIGVELMQYQGLGRINVHSMNWISGDSRATRELLQISVEISVLIPESFSQYAHKPSCSDESMATLKLFQLLSSDR